MAYSTSDDVKIAAGGEKNLAELADHDGDGYADAAVVARAISTADGEIDERLAKQYTVPLSSVPDGIRNRSAELAVFHLKRWRNRGQMTPEDLEWKKVFFEELGGFAAYALALPSTTEAATEAAPARVDAQHDRPDEPRVESWRKKFEGFA